MALPDIINRLFSFTGFQQSQGDNSFPGTNIDADLDQTNNALNALRSVVASVIRADGKIANGAVTRSSLGADLLLGVGPSKPWSASAAYTANADTVTRNNKVYLSIRNSVGVDPAADITSAYWLQTADITTAVIVAPGSLTAAAFADASLTEPKYATGSGSTRMLADGSVTRAKAAAGLGIVPYGSIQDYAGVDLPAGWLWCAGQAVSRTVYANLFSALTVSLTANTTTSTNTLTALSRQVGNLGLRAAAVEGPGIPAGTIVVSDSGGVLTLNNNVTASGAGVTIRLFPYGRGDGSSTFNLPDARGRAAAGRDDMGGVAAGRFVAPLDGSNLATTGGSTQAAIVNANLPRALPSGAVTVSYPAHQYIRYNDLTTVSAGAGGTPVAGVWRDVSGQSTQPPGNQTFSVTLSNPGGDQPLTVLQPTFVTNKIIFAGV